MANIAFIILAHEYPDDIVELATILAAYDSSARVIIHYDRNSPVKSFHKIRLQLNNYPQIYLMEERIKCAWGDFSLVQATVSALHFIQKHKINCTHVMLISGSCMPIRPLMELSHFLDAHPNQEFIETADSSWIIGGLREERYQYWHFFHHHQQNYLFTHHYRLQKKILPKRKFPHGLDPRFGSQWWCLTWNTCEQILDYIQTYPFKYFFFATTWIPDELFFQTLVFYLIPKTKLANRTLTLFYFNQYGRPLIFYDEHLSLLKMQAFFFARKINHRAKSLRVNLKKIALTPSLDNEIIPLLNNNNYRFPYARELAQIPQAGLGIPQLFQRDIQDDGLNQSMEFNKSFVILYGPPILISSVAQVLRNNSQFEVFGRLFTPGKVAFSDQHQEFYGLQDQDHLIRDMDPINYLARILRRTHKFPVWELCPGENIPAERAFLAHPQALILAILPNHLSAEFSYRLFWILTAGTLFPNQCPENQHKKSLSAILDKIDDSIPKEFRLQITEFLQSVQHNHEADLNQWGASINLIHQHSAGELAAVIPEMEERLARISNSELIINFPWAWRVPLQGITKINLNWKIFRPLFPIFPIKEQVPIITDSEKNTHLHKVKKGIQLIHFFRRVHYAYQLKNIIDRVNKITTNAILLICCCNYEVRWINFFCDYYRQLGVNHFLFIVQHSLLDNFRVWARTQPDISLWSTQASYLDSHYGIEWCNYLLNKYGVGHLCLTINPDEFLVYPKMESRNLEDLGRFLKMDKLDCLHTVTLEAYHNFVQPFGDANPFTAYPYFDRDGYIQTPGQHNIPSTIRGGPIMRKDYLDNPEKAPALNNIPLVWWRSNFHYLKSTRELFPRRVMTTPKEHRSLISGALFKFPLAAQDARTDLFRVGISVKYKSPLQLIKLGLISQGNWI